MTRPRFARSYTETRPAIRALIEEALRTGVPVSLTCLAQDGERYLAAGHVLAVAAGEVVLDDDPTPVLFEAIRLAGFAPPT